jgi:hypothetical protein
LLRSRASAQKHAQFWENIRLFDHRKPKFLSGIWGSPPEILQLKIQDNTNLITLQLKPNRSLFADGTVQVNGRVIVGTTEDPKNPFIFAPKVARCPVGTLVANY